jgi:hypothetical protein
MGAMAKITPAQIAIIGVILTIIAAVIIWFTLIKPQNELMEQHQAKLDAATTVANRDPEAKRDRQKALAEVAKAEADWRKWDRQLMPDINISNLITGSEQFRVETVKLLGPRVDKFLTKDTSVRIVQKQLSLPAPSADPNAVAKQVFDLPLGSVTVQGTFPAVLKHTERWNKFDRLLLLDGLTLSGNSPRLNATYSLRCYIFTHGEKAGPAIPQASPAQGGFPGGGGDFPGAPPPGEFAPPDGSGPAGVPPPDAAPTI